MPEIQPKERPILFSGPMVCAILEDRKTVTRRVVKYDLASRFDEPRGQTDVDAGYPFVEFDYGWVSAVKICPYGQPGDRLWVRESLRYDPEYGHYFAAGGQHGEQVFLCTLFDDEEAQTGYSYDGLLPERSVPSIHLHRRYSRMLLEITAVRVERLQGISEEQAEAEGIERDTAHPTLWKRGPLHGDQNTVQVTAFPKLAFRSIWEAINGHESWAANPWVWVVEFKRITP